MTDAGHRLQKSNVCATKPERGLKFHAAWEPLPPSPLALLSTHLLLRETCSGCLLFPSFLLALSCGSCRVRWLRTSPLDPDCLGEEAPFCPPSWRRLHTQPSSLLKLLPVPCKEDSLPAAVSGIARRIQLPLWRILRDCGAQAEPCLL